MEDVMGGIMAEVTVVARRRRKKRRWLAIKLTDWFLDLERERDCECEFLWIAMEEFRVALI